MAVISHTADERRVERSPSNKANNLWSCKGFRTCRHNPTNHVSPIDILHFMSTTENGRLPFLIELNLIEFYQLDVSWLLKLKLYFALARNKSGNIYIAFIKILTHPIVSVCSQLLVGWTRPLETRPLPPPPPPIRAQMVIEGLPHRRVWNDDRVRFIGITSGWRSTDRKIWRSSTIEIFDQKRIL